jgi:thioredoxin 1
MKNKLISLFCITLMFSSLTAFAGDFHVGPISGHEILKDLKKFAQHKDDLTYTDADLAELRAIARPITVKVFFGEWCHDSIREVPRLITLFEQTNNSNIRVEYFGLDLKKSDPEGIALAHSIKKTPTVIVFRDDEELGRFLEFPKTDWANDIATVAKRETM